MYHLNKKLLFVHIPKTAGQSVTTCIFSRRGLHRTVAQYAAILEDLDQPPLDDFFKFSFVRNPWDRVVSYYAMISEYRHTIYALSRLYDYIYDTFGSFDFSKFLECIAVAHYRGLPVNLDTSTKSEKDLIDPYVATLSQELYPQTYWLRLDGNMCMDYVGKFENLQSDFIELCKKIGLPKSRGLFKHIMKSKRTHYRDYYDSRTRDLVGDLYSSDIKEFSYDY